MQTASLWHQVAQQLDEMYADMSRRTIKTQERFIIDGVFYVGAWINWRFDGCVKDPIEYLPKNISNLEIIRY